MNKFIRKNNKKILAIVGAFLMVSFLATTRYNPSSGNRGAAAVGHIGETEPVTEGEVERARQDWKLLSRALVVEYPVSKDQMQWIPLLSTPTYGALRAVSDDPKLYTLLQKEADRMGVVVTQQQVDEFLTTPKQVDRLPAQVAIRMPDPDTRVIPFNQLPDPDYAAEVRDAAASLVRVLGGFERAASITKVSRPLVAYAMAQDHQQLQIRYTSSDATRFIEKVPAPTTQQLQEQFDKFANTEPSGTTSEKNPFGFGYKIPDQVRLQTIAIPRRQLKEAVKRQGPKLLNQGGVGNIPLTWPVAARSYYNSHKADFATTKPSATLEATMVTTQPTTKPFEEVQDQVMDVVMAPEIDALAQSVQQSILSTLSADWTAYHAAHPASGPSAEAKSSQVKSTLGVPYDSYDYLKALAAKIQKDFGVLPETADYHQPMSSPALAKLPGIGSAHSTSGSLGFEAAAFQPTLSLFEPGPPMDADAGTYLFRLTDRIAAHAPASVAAVAPAVTDDWKKAQAYDLAKAQAQQLLDAARKSDLRTAANAINQPVTLSPFFGGSAEPSDALPSILVSESAKLLTPAAKHEPAIALVEAPTQSKIYVTELAAVRPDWPDGRVWGAEVQTTNELRNEFAQPLRYFWFTLPAVEARLGYKDVPKNKTS